MCVFPIFFFTFVINGYLEIQEGTKIEKQFSFGVRIGDKKIGKNN